MSAATANSALIDPAALAADLQPIGLADWAGALAPLLATRLSAANHGDFTRWCEALARIDASLGNTQALTAALLELSPWRKGPFDLGGVYIDSEWRSDQKWARIAGRIQPLDGRHVLDVGCGNGYYALRMRAAGARCVIGIDPTLLYVMQFLAAQRFHKMPHVHVLPLRLNELPPAGRRFDTVFSMGVLYHQRSPIDHLRELRDTLRPGGELVLETLYLPGSEAFARTPAKRYARMKNVWLLPTLAELETWLARSGYRNVLVVDRSVTTVEEQRSTEWMRFESLADALDPDNPDLTVEGWPAPRRVVVTASVP